MHEGLEFKAFHIAFYAVALRVEIVKEGVVAPVDGSSHYQSRGRFVPSGSKAPVGLMEETVRNQYGVQPVRVAYYPCIVGMHVSVAPDPDADRESRCEALAQLRKAFGGGIAIVIYIKVLAGDDDWYEGSIDVSLPFSGGVKFHVDELVRHGFHEEVGGDVEVAQDKTAANLESGRCEGPDILYCRMFPQALHFTFPEDRLYAQETAEGGKAVNGFGDNDIAVGQQSALFLHEAVKVSVGLCAHKHYGTAKQIGDNEAQHLPQAKILAQQSEQKVHAVCHSLSKSYYRIVFVWQSVAYGSDYHPYPILLLTLLQKAAHYLCIAGIQVADGFVEQEEIGGLYQHPHKCHTLLLPEGEAGTGSIELFLQAQLAQHTARLLLCTVIGKKVLEHHVLQCRQFREQPVFLKHESQGCPAQSAHAAFGRVQGMAVLVQEFYPTLIVRAQAIEERAEGGLTPARSGLYQIRAALLEGEFLFPNVRRSALRGRTCKYVWQYVAETNGFYHLALMLVYSLAYSHSDGKVFKLFEGIGLVVHKINVALHLTVVIDSIVHALELTKDTEEFLLGPAS